jgi:phosphate transport system protein
MTNPSYRAAFNEELSMIAHDVVSMGARAEHMVGMAVQSLNELDVVLARSVLAKDDEIDKLYFEIEARCLRTLVLHNPLAGDFRLIGGTLKIITDIERIADLAVDIAKIGMKIDKEFGSPNIVDLPRMAVIAQEMFRISLQGFGQTNLEVLQPLNEMEDEVDAMYRELRESVFSDMRRSPENVVSDGWLLLAVHHVERIADHAMNIAERVRYVVSGELSSTSLIVDSEP